VPSQATSKRRSERRRATPPQLSSNDVQGRNGQGLRIRDKKKQFKDKVGEHNAEVQAPGAPSGRDIPREQPALLLFTPRVRASPQARKESAPIHPGRPYRHDPASFGDTQPAPVVISTPVQQTIAEKPPSDSTIVSSLHTGELRSANRKSDSASSEDNGGNYVCGFVFMRPGQAEGSWGCSCSALASDISSRSR
jgi:hypothetical protein